MLSPWDYTVQGLLCLAQKSIGQIICFWKYLLV